jgi:hypothetical protein
MRQPCGTIGPLRFRRGVMRNGNLKALEAANHDSQMILDSPSACNRQKLVREETTAP